MLTHSRARTPAARLRFERLEDRWVPATLFVDDDGGRRADFTTIQAAVDAARPGDTILVAPGTYREAVTFGPDKDDISLRAQKPLAAVIQAPAGTGALVRVFGADDVEVRGFTLTGDAEFGVQVDAGGSATVRDNLITSIRSSVSDITGYGVFVGGRVAEGETAGEATVRNNTVIGYESGGVFVSNPGSDAEVTGNLIVGSGPSDSELQYGVIVGFGADAVVARNTIAGNVYTPDEFDAAGVYAILSGDVEVRDNVVFGNEVGVLVEANEGKVAVTRNSVFGNSSDGIALFEATGVVVEGNRVSRNGGDGIVLEGSTGNLVTKNDVTRNAGAGLRVTLESAGNTLLKNDLRGNAGPDAFDDTAGPGTGGTANTWSKNRFDDSNRPGLD